MNIMKYLLVILFLFSIGSFIGWILEFFFRRFFSKNNPSRRWINPGFLVGPCLPLYGFSLITLYLLSMINFSFIENLIARKIVLFIFMSICITFIEYIAGLIFIKGMKIKLWDYSECRGNIRGIICPQFSFYWVVLSAFYYFLINPKITEWVFWFTNHITFSFVIGFYYGIMTVDLIYSFNILAKIRKLAVEYQVVVRYENFRNHVRQLKEERKEKINFLFSLHSEKDTISDFLKKYIDKIKNK